ncbi:MULTISPECIES: rhodanese-like domain-containing protein [unclassified Neptuniibacter]|jgi:PQQ-dependent catabolism-associated CXXCW motif protein|uniref:rhodanese-like domain-containing protein n=1 Tax=unclassified Neptuniibacter TaxID=2630693 RepID=UPI0026E2103F|nr:MULTISPECIES: rhodanese-like domain-containing protein [unclassified Neptuniibacter]MDO6514452.1 rhodanese-like domain-containing protein [Neptuniibacter sp. 2_MG-2023]MDO6594474.1 rhodanese-like domain-containing protein [Neptuniibacter sp. 1_MG-2023]
MLGSTIAVAATNSDAYVEESDDDFGLFNVDGYRLFRYRSPTPNSSEHAETLTLSTLLALLEKDKNVVLLDVQPLLWNRVFIQKEPRLHIPGSLWLPNVGRGELEPEWEEYFRSNLTKITAGNKQRPIVIYCRADCWMSWNALKRASSWGYSRLYWYRNGSDGWIENNMETSVAQPIPFQPQDDH